MVISNPPELVSMLMTHAIERLSQACRFQPFGAYLQKSNEIVPVVARIGCIGMPSQKEIDQLSLRLLTLAATSQIRAMCLCSQITLHENDHHIGNNAIFCIFEDAEGLALDWVLPFVLDKKTKSLVFHELECKRRRPAFFPTHNSRSLTLMRRRSLNMRWS